MVPCPGSGILVYRRFFGAGTSDAVFRFGTDTVWYSEFILSTVVLNRVMLLGKSQIQLFIISDKYREIRQKVLTDIDAGVTMVDIETGYGEQKQQGVLCVIHSRKLYSVKEAIQEIDPKAFITITQINEVRGRGFTMEKLRYDELNHTKN